MQLKHQMKIAYLLQRAHEGKEQRPYREPHDNGGNSER